MFFYQRICMSKIIFTPLMDVSLQLLFHSDVRRITTFSPDNHPFLVESGEQMQMVDNLALSDHFLCERKLN